MYTERFSHTFQKEEKEIIFLKLHAREMVLTCVAHLFGMLCGMPPVPLECVHVLELAKCLLATTLVSSLTTLELVSMAKYILAHLQY